MAIRLNRYLSESGYCSRREADGIIASRTVTVNGNPGEFFSRVSPSDVVAIDGERVMPRRAIDFTPKEAPKVYRPRKVVADDHQEWIPKWKKDRIKTEAKERPSTTTNPAPKKKAKAKPSKSSKKYVPKKTFNS